ncbi:uncharacterized protein LY89DRAFT_613994 [Mollisia scopiformis]|uniref:Glycosyl transferase CAP10 domain-containing protein n=1 Tax=Mollisia scopiformis TaxID=149040 RepID=A0A194XFF8_MOLSC|nr:uncharacterized protein LY89DRAFT_613994 [Mollisia scopiformis]KUJ18869.1 hypothetical protein LY89DRAFT_613994 [Mollisia scopiformis]
MASRYRFAARVFCLVAITCLLYGFYHGTIWAFSRGAPSKEVLNSLNLSEDECRATFPYLMKEIDDAVSRGPFKLDKEPDDYQGLVQARIKNGKLYIISAGSRLSRDMLYEREAILHQIYRALITSPEPIPDTIFTFSILDTVRENVWCFARSNDPKIQGSYWVMPHFSFWSWPKSFIGTVDEALAKTDVIERDIPWSKKIDKVVWRGTAWFNSIGNNALRPNLIAATKGKDWADVQILEWGTNADSAKNALNIEDFCKYKYIIYTEGITYSGRLPYHQACASIIITPPPSYLMHNTHLMRPLFSSSLSLSPGSKTNKQPNTDARWLKSYKASQANVVFVDPEWKDLEQTVMWLRAHPDVAEGIANRQRKMIAEAGYLSPASEVCYWRSLIRGWSQVVEIDEEVWGKWDSQGVENGEGIRWETFSLTGKADWS